MNSISGYNGPDYYFYEINNSSEDFRIVLSVSSKNASPDLMAEFDRLIDFYKPRIKKKVGWEWKRLCSSFVADYKDNPTKEQIWSQLDKMLAEVLEMEEKYQDSLVSD